MPTCGRMSTPWTIKRANSSCNFVKNQPILMLFSFLDLTLVTSFSYLTQLMLLHYLVTVETPKISYYGETTKEICIKYFSFIKNGTWTCALDYVICYVPLKPGKRCRLYPAVLLRTRVAFSKSVVMSKLGCK